MNKKYLFYFLPFNLLFFICTTCLSQSKQPPKELSYSITEAPRTVEVRINKTIIKTCKVDSTVDRANLSYDKKTLLISGNGYVTTKSLVNCRSQAIPTKYTPSKNGYLVDFNSSKNRYIALDFVALQPLSYIAFIGEIGKRKNLVNLPGAYSDKKSLKTMQAEAFGYLAESLYAPKISLNGRYVDPAGDVDCSAQSHPGIWDIEKNKKVFFAEKVDLLAKCKSLFEK